MADAEQIEKLQAVRSAFGEADLSRYLKHDIGNHIAPFAAIYEVIAGREAVLDPEPGKMAYEEMLTDIAQLSIGDFPLFARHLRRAPHVLAVMPAIRASISFLNEPNAENYQAFQGIDVPFQSVLRMAGADTICSSDDLINGPRAVMALNLAENARSYGMNNRFRVDINGDILSTRNLSEYPLPDNPFELGVKGPRGRSGIGLFIAKSYSDLEGIPLGVTQETIRSSYRRGVVKGWDISFAFSTGAYSAALLPFNIVELRTFEPVPSKPS